MKRFLLALIVCPVVAAAQKPAKHWSIEGATGMTASRHLDQIRTFWGAISASATTGEQPAGLCFLDCGMGMAALTGGIAAARKAHDTGRFASVRASGYMYGEVPGVQRGAYVGAGVAVPTSFGGLAFEIGAHTFAFAPDPNWLWRP